MKIDFNWKKQSWKIPDLSMGKRILLYILMILSAALALYNVATEKFPFAVGIICYVLAAFTLFSGIYYLVKDVIQLINRTKGYMEPKIEANPLVKKMSKDIYLKTVVDSLPETIISVLYAVYNGYLGIRYSSPWLGTMSAYYIILAVMRLGAIRQNQKIKKITDEKQRMRKEDTIYRRNSMLFMIMAIVLGGVVILVINEAGGQTCGEYTIFVVALYTFYKVINALIVMAKDRKSHSPLITIVKKVNYIDSLVSILMLQTALLTAFGNGQQDMINTFNLFTGIGVCIMILIAGVQGIIISDKRRKRWKEEETHDSYISSRR